MATPQEAAICAICKKVSLLFDCAGCQKKFCADHLAEHRKELQTQLTEVANKFLEEKKVILDCSNGLTVHPLIETINTWEATSKAKIEEQANTGRKYVQALLCQKVKEMQPFDDKLSKELDQAMETQKFFENDLRTCEQNIQHFKAMFFEPNNILVTDDAYPEPGFIDRKTVIAIQKTKFGDASDSVRLGFDDEVISIKASFSDGAARSIDKYTTGSHLFRLLIENLEQSVSRKWILFGVISASTPVQKQSYTSPSVYGWAGRDEVYLNGKKVTEYRNYISDFDKSDELNILIDCDLCTIEIINRRTHRIHRLQVDSSLCPLPWQLFICLYYTNDQVRLLKP